MSVPHLSSVESLKDEFRDRDDYNSELLRLQEELLHIQQTLYARKERAIIIFEGTDASGKGGVIRRATQLLDPRGFRVHPIGKPHPDEQGRHYLWRFFQHLPPPGKITIFDRSWYGRVLVERVEELIDEDTWQRAYQEINEFERWLTDDGVRLIKVFLSIDKNEQDKRFEERLTNPLKHWKLTEEDIRNRLKWDDYVDATNELLARTHSPNAPWFLIDGRRKWRTRLKVLTILKERLSDGIDVSEPSVDHDLLKRVRHELGLTIN